MRRSWITRRVVWTSDCIYISKVGEEIIIDSIPLSEADSITCNNELVGSGESMVKGKFDRDASMTSMSRKINPEDANEVKNKKVKYPKDSRIDDIQPVKGKIVLQLTTIPEGFNSGANLDRDKAQLSLFSNQKKTAICLHYLSAIRTSQRKLLLASLQAEFTISASDPKKTAVKWQLN
jgi:hypothetical protein